MNSNKLAVEITDFSADHASVLVNEYLLGLDSAWKL